MKRSIVYRTACLFLTVTTVLSCGNITVLADSIKTESDYEILEEDVSSNVIIDISNGEDEGEETEEEEIIPSEEEEKKGMTYDDLTKPSGKGTEDSPYKVYDKYELLYLATYVKSAMVIDLCSDITFSEGDFNTLSNNKYVINNSLVTLNGKKHTISGLTRSLFWEVGENCSVTDLTISNSDLGEENGTTTGGGFVASSNSGLIRNITVKNSTIEGKGTAATIANYNYPTGIIDKCTNYIDLEATAGMGGIVLSNQGTISNCTNYGNLKASDYTQRNTMSRGGICGGSSGGEITNCVNYGNVTAYSYAGGIAGTLGGTHASKCINYGDVTTYSGFVGGAFGTTGSHNNVPSSVEDCSSYGNISGGLNSSQKVGGFTGEVGGGVVIKRCGVLPKDGATIKVYSTSAYTGGFTSYLMGTMENCFVIADVEGGNYSGGIAGLLTESADKSSIPEIRNCYFAGSVTAPKYAAYPIIAHLSLSEGCNPVMENCYFDKNLCTYQKSQYTSVDYYEGTGKTTAEFASGDVMNLLNANCSSPIWYQILSGENKETYPTLNDNSNSLVTGEGVYYLSSVDTESGKVVLDKTIKAYLTDETASKLTGEVSSYLHRYLYVSVAPNEENTKNVIKEIGTVNSVFGQAMVDNSGVTINGVKYTASVNIPSECNGKYLLIHINGDSEIIAYSILEQVGIKSIGTLTEEKIGLNGFGDYRKSYLAGDSLLNDIKAVEEWNLEKNHFCVLADKYHNVYDVVNATTTYVPEKITGTYGYISSMVGGEDNLESYDFAYDDNWLNESTTSYNHDLVIMAFKAEMAAFDISSKKSSNMGKDNIDKLMDDLHYDKKEFYGYGYNSTNSVAYAIASKTVMFEDGPKSILLVTLRGAGYGDEWGGNLNMGSGENGAVHEGFEIGAKEVVKGLKQYLEDYCLEENKVVWITGYSRGAAITNLVAAHLDDGEVPGFDNSNVFAFCFECPRNTTDSNVNNPKYNNIKSFINPIDLVPKLAMAKWGFSRYGKVYNFPSSSTDFNYSEYYTRMQQAYYRIISDYASTYGMTQKEKNKLVEKITYEGCFQSEAFDDFVNMLANCAGNRSNYYREYQKSFMKLAQEGLGPSEADAGTAITGLNTLYRLFTSPNPVRTTKTLFYWKKGTFEEGVKDILAGTDIEWDYDGVTFAVPSGIDAVLLNCHWPELSLAWLEALSEEELSSKENQKKWSTNTVRVTILGSTMYSLKLYDPLGNTLGNAFSEEVHYNSADASFESDENGQIRFVIPAYEAVNFEILSEDETCVNCTVETINGDTGNVDKLVFYQNLEIGEGKSVKCSLEDSDSLMKDASGEEISPTSELGADDQKLFSVTISSYGGGRVTESFSANYGETVVLTATPYKGENFYGWYKKVPVTEDDWNLEYLSSEKEYRFTVTEDVFIRTSFSSNKQRYQVTFIDDHTDIVADSEVKEYVVAGIESGKTAKLPAEPILETEDKSYVFVGWYTGRKGQGTQFTEKTKVKSYMQVYAYWLPLSKYSDSTGTYFISDIPDQQYTGKKLTPTFVVKDGTKRLVSGKDYKATYSANTNVGKACITIEGKGNYTKKIKVYFNIVPRDLSNYDISATVSDRKYTGTPQKAAPVVYYGKTKMVANKDYVLEYTSEDNNECIEKGTVIIKIIGKGKFGGERLLSYRISDNDISKATIVVNSVSYQHYKPAIPEVLVYEDKEKTKLLPEDSYELYFYNNYEVGKGKVRITGKNDYFGTKTVDFKITQVDLNSEEISINAYFDTTTYNGKAQKISFSVKRGDYYLYEGRDYTVSYKNNVNACDKSASKAPEVIITGKGNYKGKISYKFTISKKNINDYDVNITGPSDMVYTGNPVKPSVSISYGKYKLKSSEYTLEYADNIEKGSKTAKVIIKVNSKNFTGEKTLLFSICDGNISKYLIDVSKQTYTGEALEPIVKIYVDKKAKNRGEALVLGEDYIITQIENNTSSGTASFVVRGIGKYGGEKKVTFKIDKFDIKKNAGSRISAEVDCSAPIVYTGQSVKPKLIVKDGENLLTEGRDYSVSYKNNVNAAADSAKKRPEISLTGKGNYTGIYSQKIYFSIEKRNLTSENAKIKVGEMKYTGSALKPSVTVTYNGKTLKKDKDYTVSYKNNVYAEERNANEAPTVIVKGKGNFSDAEITETFRIYSKAISGAGFVYNSKVLYTGKSVKPQVKVYANATAAKKSDETKLLTEGKDYSVSYGTNNKIGKGTVTITGRGEYGGTKTITFKILPKWLKWLF